ncbi:MAG: TIR domain-containing protein [Planctomycetaceae bacterium]
MDKFNTALLSVRCMLAERFSRGDCRTNSSELIRILGAVSAPHLYGCVLQELEGSGELVEASDATAYRQQRWDDGGLATNQTTTTTTPAPVSDYQSHYGFNYRNNEDGYEAEQVGSKQVRQFEIRRKPILPSASNCDDAISYAKVICSVAAYLGEFLKLQRLVCRPTTWGEGELYFRVFEVALMECRDLIKAPPVELQDLRNELKKAAVLARKVSNECDHIDFRQDGLLAEFFPDFNSVASDISHALNKHHARGGSKGGFDWLDDDKESELDSGGLELSRGTVGKNRFTVAFSFAGEWRNVIEPIVEHLAKDYGKERILYDKYHSAEFARPNLNAYLPNLYLKESELVVVLLSPEYREKSWCGLEWRYIASLIAKKEYEKIMFLKVGASVDLSELGILSGDGYLAIDEMTSANVKSEVVRRLELNRGL